MRHGQTELQTSAVAFGGDTREQFIRWATTELLPALQAS
jgi:hypothetical protein